MRKQFEEWNKHRLTAMLHYKTLNIYKANYDAENRNMACELLSHSVHHIPQIRLTMLKYTTSVDSRKHDLLVLDQQRTHDPHLDWTTSVSINCSTRGVDNYTSEYTRNATISKTLMLSFQYTNIPKDHKYHPQSPNFKTSSLLYVSNITLMPPNGTIKYHTRCQSS